jgi:hypothetical protein
MIKGAYTWIRFIDVASKGVYCRPTKDKLGKITHKHEPHGEGGVG